MAALWGKAPNSLHITDELMWTTNITSLVKKAQQCLHLLWKMRRADFPLSALTTFSRGANISSLSVWDGSCCGECSTKAGEDNREDHQNSPTIHSGLISIPLLQESHQYHQRLQPPAHDLVSTRPPESTTAFSHRPSDSTHSRKFHEHNPTLMKTNHQNDFNSMFGTNKCLYNTLFAQEHIGLHTYVSSCCYPALYRIAPQ